MLNLAKERCSGCRLCEALCPKQCIEMIENEEGFLYARIINTDKCIDCGLCEKMCPMANHKFEEGVVSNNSFAVQLRDKKMLNECASGGAFAAIAIDVLNNGGCVCGASETELNRLTFKFVTDIDDLYSILGSKYYQCDLPKEILLRIVEMSKKQLVLFGGTPCQVAAVKKIVPERYMKNVLTVDIICQGVPSSKAIAYYRKYKEEQLRKKIRKHQFRCKDRYIGRDYLSKYTFEDGKVEYNCGAEDLYSLSFQRQILLRESCYSCPFASKRRISDITVGDYWNKDIQHKEQFLFEQGVSLVICNTKKGYNIVHNSENIDCISVDIDEIRSTNIPLNYPVRRPYSRKYSYKMLFSKLGVKWTTYLCCWKYSIKKMFHL